MLPKILPGIRYRGIKNLSVHWQADLDKVLESIQAPRFIDFTEMVGREHQAPDIWRQSMGPVPHGICPQKLSTPDSADNDDDFRLSPPKYPCCIFDLPSHDS